MNENSNTKSYLKMLRMLHLAITIGAGLFVFIIWFVSDNQEKPSAFYLSGDISFIIVLFVAAGTLGMVQVFIPKVISHIPSDVTLENKLVKYRLYFVIRIAVLEVPVMLAGVMYMLQLNLTLLVVALIMLAYMAFQYPVKSKIVKELNLNDSEQSKIDD